MDRAEQVAGLPTLAPLGPETGEAGGRAQLPGARAAAARDASAASRHALASSPAAPVTSSARPRRRAACPRARAPAAAPQPAPRRGSSAPRPRRRRRARPQPARGGERGGTAGCRSRPTRPSPGGGGSGPQRRRPRGHELAERLDTRSTPPTGQGRLDGFGFTPSRPKMLVPELARCPSDEWRETGVTHRPAALNAGGAIASRSRRGGRHCLRATTWRSGGPAGTRASRQAR